MPPYSQQQSNGSALSFLHVADNTIGSLEFQIGGLLGHARKQLSECQSALVAEQYRRAQCQTINQRLARDLHSSALLNMQLRHELDESQKFRETCRCRQLEVLPTIKEEQSNDVSLAVMPNSLVLLT